eukprot:50978-Eustigmatos_ZCMA.PRE.1
MKALASPSKKKDTRYEAPPMYITEGVIDEIANIISHPEKDKEYTHYQFYVDYEMIMLHESIVAESADECSVVATNSQAWG